MKRGLFINNKKAKDSIYESGFMVYHCLKLSDKYLLDYCEVDIDDLEIKTGYDFYFFNYHPVTMRWLDTGKLKKELGYVITMILEMAPGDPFFMCPRNHFNFYCALDPTIISKQKSLYAFPRPLESINFPLPAEQNEIPVIGSFGFATKGKGFHHVVEAVNKEFEKAIVKINIPYGDFVEDSEQYAKFIGELCKQKAKKGIDVQVTHDFMDKESLIRWCAANTLNCFLYDRDLQGLAATTDQAISSGRPLSISDNNTFRHITAYLPPYPKCSLKDSIEKSGQIVNQMKEEWSPDQFVKKFEGLLFKNLPLTKIPKQGDYVLPLIKRSLKNSIQKQFKKVNVMFRKAMHKGIFKRKRRQDVI
ncbi:MAG: hypothetical protein ABIY51_07150 [Ferruginibacter sp.]